MNLREQRITSSLKYQGNIVDVYLDEVVLPNGRRATRDVVRHCPAVVIVPILPDGRVVFVEQYRYPLEAVLLELPAGKMDEVGESALDCARRELQEETGYVAGDLQYLGKMATSPGFCDEIIHVFCGKQLKLAEACPDADEFLRVRALSVDEIRDLVRQGQLFDSKSITALFYAGYSL